MGRHGYSSSFKLVRKREEEEMTWGSRSALD